ncbi:hypothetical protein DV736_g2610, partial [Chaetothyriales sp. CBS 134916]
MSSSNISPSSAKRPRTATYNGSRTTLRSMPPTRTSDRWSRVPSTFSDITKTLFGPDATAEKQNEPDHDSAYASKEDSVMEEPVPTRQSVPARQSRRKAKEATQAAHDDFDNDDNNKYDKYHSPEPDDTTRRSTRAAKKRLRSSTTTTTTTVAVAAAEHASKTKGRGRKPVAASKTASPQPKGILTPSSKRRQRPAKSVVFSSSRSSEKQIEQQLGFRDIDPTPTRKVTPGAIDEPASESQCPPHADNVDNRLTSSSTPARAPSLIPSHLSSGYSTLTALLSSTITTSESNSLLLLGARGSGKSLLVNTALSSLSRQHAGDFHIVRLNGFLQTDDRLALREIWRQLGRERAVDADETGQVMASYADTMASLLGLLSHPDEIAAAPDMNAMDAEDTTVQTTSKSVIIVIDEFDLFTTHPRQTLLYNLFDIAQSRKAPIAVIGCSTRMDVVDCLEKRVKSRFSHRWVHIPTAKTLAAFNECVQTILCVSDDEVVDHVDETDRHQWNHAVTNDLLTRPHVHALLARTFYSTKSPADVLTKLYLPVATLSLHSSQPHSPPSTTPNPSHSAPSLMLLLPTLPPLHLALLIAASRLDSIYLAPAVNFNAVFAHYSLLHRHTRSKLATASSPLRLCAKATCKSAWEDLLRWKFLVVIGGGGGTSARDERGESELMSDDARWCRVEITLDDVAAALGPIGGWDASIGAAQCMQSSQIGLTAKRVAGNLQNLPSREQKNLYLFAAALLARLIPFKTAPIL